MKMIEIISAELLKNIGIIIGVPMFRALCGWFPKAYADGFVTKLEVKELILTLMNIGSVSVMTYYGLNGMGIDVTLLGATSSAFIFDKVYGIAKDFTKKK